MGVKIVFWNAEESRVRAGWRLLTQLFLIIAFSNILVSADKYFIDYLPVNPQLPNNSFFQPFELLLATFLSMFLTAKYLDKRPFSNFGFIFNRKWFKDFYVGLSLGVFLMSLIFLFEYLAGWITITDQFKNYNIDYSFTYAMISGGFLFICVGFYEELQVRSYLLKNLSEGLNFKNNKKRAIIIAVSISSLVFGFGHASNPNATLVSSLSITLAGILLALGYIFTGRMAIPIGFHITWNFFQGYVYGFPVSGTSSAASYIVIEQGGPEIWTGGAFGPEAGLIGIITFIIGGILIFYWVKFSDNNTNLVEEIAVYKKPELIDVISTDNI